MVALGLGGATFPWLGGIVGQTLRFARDYLAWRWYRVDAPGLIRPLSESKPWPLKFRRNGRIAVGSRHDRDRAYA